LTNAEFVGHTGEREGIESFAIGKRASRGYDLAFVKGS
jgi:hypothetical protein